MSTEEVSGGEARVVKEFESGLLDRLRRIEDTVTGVLESKKDDLEELRFLKDDVAFVTGLEHHNWGGPRCSRPSHADPVSELLSPVQSQYSSLRSWAESVMTGATESEKKQMQALLLRDCGAIAEARHLDSFYFGRKLHGSDQVSWVLEPEHATSLGLYTARYGKPDKLASIESYEEYQEETGGEEGARGEESRNRW